jgi:hypothetical protein
MIVSEGDFDRRVVGEGAGKIRRGRVRKRVYGRDEER